MVFLFGPYACWGRFPRAVRFAITNWNAEQPFSLKTASLERAYKHNRVEINQTVENADSHIPSDHSGPNRKDRGVGSELVKPRSVDGGRSAGVRRVGLARRP